MSNWLQMLKEAKEALELGLIDESEFASIKEEAMALRGQGVSATSSTNEDDLSGETQMFTGAESIEDELSSDTLAGTTQFVPEVDVDEASDPLSSDTLAGSTQFVPDFDMDAGNDTLSGVTMMGKVVSLNDDNIENLPAGTVFDGRYSVVAPLGKGGMGMVYEVIDPKVKQRMALKVLRPEIANNQRVIDSFAEEVAIGQRLNHPNLLQIRHLETRSDSPYVIMELMEGGDVDEHLAANGGKISSQSTLSIMKQTCSALSALHNERIIHLDLKPQNLLMNADGTVKLSDFGISSSLKDQRGGHSGSGTLFYAPPEQMDGGQCDVRTDIYALGMMTGQLLTGCFPFALKRAEEVQEWHRSGSRDFGYLPGKVAQVLGRACAVSMDDRYRTVAEFIGELEKALDHKPWYPPSLPLESVHPSLVLVNGTEHTMDVANLLPQGVLTPSLTLKGGKVLMQSNPFALAEIGVLDYLSAELKPVVEDILSGSDSKLSGLSKQDSTTESQLAMLATRAEISDRSIQRRLYYASDSLSTLEDRLTLAYTHRTAMKDMKSSNDLMESIGQGTIPERLEVSLYQRWLELAERAVQRSMFAIEEDCKSPEEWQGLATAHVSLFDDWNGADSALTRANQEQPSTLKRAIEDLIEPIKLYGLRNPLKEAGDRLDNLADSPADYAKIAEFWKTVGAGDAASKAEEERQALFRSTVQSLVQRLVKLDAHIDPPGGTLSESDVVGYETQVKEQEQLHILVDDLRSTLVELDIELQIPEGLLTINIVGDFDDLVRGQVGLYNQIQDLNQRAQLIGLKLLSFEKPYTVEQVKHWELVVERQESEVKQSGWRQDLNNLEVRLEHMKIKITPPSGVLSQDLVDEYTRLVQEQMTYYNKIQKFKPYAESYAISLPEPSPVFVEASINEFVEQVTDTIYEKKQGFIQVLLSHDFSIDDLLTPIVQKERLSSEEQHLFEQNEEELNYIELRNFPEYSVFQMVGFEIIDSLFGYFLGWFVFTPLIIFMHNNQNATLNTDVVSLVLALIYILGVPTLIHILNKYKGWYFPIFWITFGGLSFLVGTSLSGIYADAYGVNLSWVWLLLFSFRVCIRMYKQMKRRGECKDLKLLNEQSMGEDIYQMYNLPWLKHAQVEQLFAWLNEYNDIRQQRIARNKDLLRVNR